MTLRYGLFSAIGFVIAFAASLAANGCVGDDPAAGPLPDDGGSPNDDAAACTDACAEGASRCGPAGVETCERQGACLAWSAPAACGDGELCCGTGCVPADQNNCFACGARCEGQTPACLSTPKKCGCDLSVCTPDGKGCDKSTGGCVECQALPASAGEIWVDRASFAGGTGTEACPFLTIKQALAAAAASTAAEKIIHVGPGVYDAAAGETFPIVVRGVSLVGAGPGKTTIRGTEPGFVNPAGGQFVGAMSLTLLVGHETEKTVVSGVTIEPPAAADVAVAVLCDRGNTAQSVGTQNPSGNTVFRNVAVGPGFDGDAAILVGTNNGSSGCNFVLEGSTLRGGKRGIWAAGAGLTGDFARVGLRVGDDTPAGSNTFRNVRHPAAGEPTIGYAVEVWDYAHTVRIAKNTFEGSVVGVLVQQNAKDAKMFVNGNTFKDNIARGVALLRSGLVDELHDNVFEGTRSRATATPADAIGLGVGLLLQRPGNIGVGEAPRIASARRNRFVGNEIGVLFDGPVNATVASDFGTAGVPGQNVMSCNSSGHGGVAGGDVVVRYANSGAASSLSFDGNEWDHGTLTTTGNGADLVNDGTNVTVTTAGAKTVAGACGAGLVK